MPPGKNASPDDGRWYLFNISITLSTESPSAAISSSVALSPSQYASITISFPPRAELPTHTHQPGLAWRSATQYESASYWACVSVRSCTANAMCRQCSPNSPAASPTRPSDPAA